MLILGIGLVSSLASGVILQTAGWQRMNMLLLPWLALCALAVIGLAVGRRQQPAPLEQAN